MNRADLEMPPAELKQRLDAGTPPRLIDVRSAQEAAICQLPGSELIPLGELQQRMEEIDPDEEAVLYCHHGMRSLNAVVFLRERGYTKIRSLAGGIDGWSAAIDPKVPRY
jgi:rhodanese-related sulfurtransferase